MALRLFGMTCGWLVSDLGGFLEGASGEIRVPVPSYLVRHPRGAVLFDSGLHPELQSDPARRLGPLANLFGVRFEAGEDIASRLAALDVDAARDVRYLVTSHLHFDHVGGNALVPNAQVAVQRREWEAGHDADLVRANFYNARDYDLGHDVLTIDGEHDLFGDGSVVLFATHGHTPGHQSLKLRLAGGTVVLTGDACYLRRSLDELRLPPHAHDRGAALDSMRVLAKLRDSGARLLFGHDPEQWDGSDPSPREIG
jgi:glyoxylase-like metal-dependent hydrolase (beta-lactamase superfamily II)